VQAASVLAINAAALVTHDRDFSRALTADNFVTRAVSRNFEFASSGGGTTRR
jgi:hypothetical protein